MIIISKSSFLISISIYNEFEIGTILDTPKKGNRTLIVKTSQTVDLDAGLTVLRLTLKGWAQDLLDIGFMIDAPLI